jgi:hypothetical protein
MKSLGALPNYTHQREQKPRRITPAGFAISLPPQASSGVFWIARSIPGIALGTQNLAGLALIFEVIAAIGEATICVALGDDDGATLFFLAEINATA